MYYKPNIGEEVMAIVVLSYALCFSLGACIGFAMACLFAEIGEEA